MKEGSTRTLEISLTAEQRLQLRCLLTSPAMGEESTLQDVVQYIIASVCDGIRRPGSWERGTVASMFGEWDYREPPMCSICNWDVLDEDEPIEMASKHCETCLSEAIDVWSVEQPEDDEALGDLVCVALDAYHLEPHRREDVIAARELCWEAMGGTSPLKPSEPSEMDAAEIAEIAKLITASLEL